MTTNGLTTCLWLDGQAEEAANHYVSIFKDSELGRVGHYTEAGSRRRIYGRRVRAQRPEVRLFALGRIVSPCDHFE